MPYALHYSQTTYMIYGVYLPSASGDTTHYDDDNQRRTQRQNEQATPEMITRIENPYYGQEEEAGNTHGSKQYEFIKTIFTTI